METKSITAIGSKKHHRFTLTVQEDNTNISENKSYLSFTFKISKYSGKYDWRYWGDAISYTVTIDTNTYTGTIPNYDGTSTVTLKSGSDIPITHESDGTKTINIAFNVTDTSGQTYTSGNASASDTMQLTTLHTLPMITDIGVVETNTFIEGIDNLDMARYLSIKRYTLTAEAYDGATISKYRVYNGNQLVAEKNSTDTNPNVLTVDYANIELQTNTYEYNLYAVVVFEVEDSLGAVRNFTYDNYFPIIPYDLPNIITTSTNVKRNGQATGQVKLNLKGTFYNETIGETTNDILMDFTYWVKGQSESSTYYGIDTSAISITNNNIDITNWVMYKAGELIEDVDKEYAYYFKIRLTDAFGKRSVSQVLCASGEYLMAKFKDRVDFKKITQQNHELMLKPVTLFEDANGENSNVLLSDLPSNYSYLEIFCIDNNGTKGGYVKVDNPTNSSWFTVFMVEAATSSTFIRRTKYTINNDTLVPSNLGYSRIMSNGGDTTTGTNYIYITKVIGWL